jgi:D-alanyl-D-alanine endopeptidase (penicillin-binding protein 7)
MSSISIELIIPALGWALLHFVWQGLIVGAAALLLLKLLRNSSPRSRYALCGLALFICLCIPLFHLGFSLAQAGHAPSQFQAAELPGWRSALQARMPALVLAWGLGVSLMTLRLSLGLVWVNRLRRSAVLAPAIWQVRLDALAHRLGLRRQVAFKLHRALSSPVTMGFWRPVVLLPFALLSKMPVPMLEALLAHELAHVRRWDYLANLLQSLVEALLFFHPVIWWLSTRMRVEREQVADELAAQALDDPRLLAQALHELSLQALTNPQPELILSARRGPLLQRIERLMAPPPETASWKLALPALLVACASVLLSGQDAPSAPQARAVEHAANSLQHVLVNAKHVLVLDEGGGQVLLAKDANAVVPIASLTKLMTAMVLLDARLDPNEKLRIAREDVGFSNAGSLLAAGLEVPRAVALKLALMSSENGAAVALARTYPGGSRAFAQALRAKIHSLGLTRTTITEPTGVSPDNTSTATEVAMIVAAAARYPEIARITSDRQAKVALNGLTRELHNTNPLVGGLGWDIRLSKTGHSAQAGRCLTMRMRSGDKFVTVVLLDADGFEQRSQDARTIRDSLARLKLFWYWPL